MDDTRDLITTGTAAELLGVSPQTVRRWADSGDLPSVRTPGNQRRFRRAAVEALLAMPEVAS
jgi:excisionase family DNA binding protein